ncbi:VOC family protein [Citricoccus sp. NPDC055426]|uniref:VOC family protein n=1 Tax=Citricoccus sp. NPDC055426 TaxID=3155536 RepID=UPI00342301BD
MTASSAFRGLAQVNIPADDVAAARDWYARALGVPPYFQQPDAEAPAYVEFRLGDHADELGIIDRRYLPPGHSGDASGVIARWHVDDLPGTVSFLTGLGATEHEPVTPRGDEGFVTASVVDPFGNVLGLIHSPHYLDQL